MVLGGFFSSVLGFMVTVAVKVTGLQMAKLTATRSK